MADFPSVILLGSKPGAATALRHMAERGWDVRCVVATPGEVLHAAATADGLRVVADQDAIGEVESVDFVISYMCRRLVRAPVRALARRAALNFHAAPLPEFGGWAFYNLAILEEASEFGVTCHHMNDSFDDGPLVCVRRFAIDASAHTALSLERLAQSHMVELFRDVCELAERDEPLPSSPQDPSRKRYLSRGEFEQLKEIPRGASPETVDRYARAFWFPPYPGAFYRSGNTCIEVEPQ